jgi:hypothetical protein
MSWAHLVEERQAEISCSSAVTCQFRHLLDVNKSYDLDFPKGCFVACCGASHGWLVLANELANLVLFNPITMEMVPLPPITDFTFVDAVYDDQGSIRGYHIFYKDKLYEAKDVATWFYQKAVLSCSPSKDGNYTVMIIHYDSNWLSFARAGESKWHVVSTLAMSERDRYADCAYHNGRFYTVTYQGIVEKYAHDRSNGPTKEAIIAHRNFSCVLTRHLVSTPWGDLLQIRAISAKRVENVRFDISPINDPRLPSQPGGLKGANVRWPLDASDPLPLFTSAIGCCRFFVTSFFSKRVNDSWGQVRVGPTSRGSGAVCSVSPVDQR